MAIVCFKHNFIFIKTAKTAGTSIEIDLSSVVGANAIVTPIFPIEGTHHPRNYQATDSQDPFFNHMPASLIRKQIGRARYERMMSFCVEREPVEKCISHFHMRRNSPQHNSNRRYPLNWDEYCEAGKFPVDHSKYAEQRDGAWHKIVSHILRYDRLEHDLQTILSQCGCPHFRLKSRAKSGYSKKRAITRQEVTLPQRARIYEAFHTSLELTRIDWSTPKMRDISP